MFYIPDFLNRDDYLQNPIMRRFLKNHKLKLVETREDYIKSIVDYANKDEDSEKEVRTWLLKVAKEGSKEICFKKIRKIGSWHKDPLLVEARIKVVYPDCPMKDILSYKNTGEKTMIEYHIITDSNDEVVRVDFTFSSLYLYGNPGETGDKTIFPVFIEVYLNEGFIVSRAKAKSTLYQYDETNDYLSPNTRIDTMSEAVFLLDKIIDLFGFETEKNPQIAKNEIAQMLYRMYEKYSFTPSDVVVKVDSQKDLINEFVKQLFSNLSLDVRNRAKAVEDARIFVEKFISINGSNEESFKQDRTAYLIKVTAKDELELTRIDTMSYKDVPLQCTEAFFDSKKAVMRSRQCKKLHLVFKRNDKLYFSEKNPLIVKFGMRNNYGYVKTMQYAEEVDIQNVLQAIFDNY